MNAVNTSLDTGFFDQQRQVFIETFNRFPGAVLCSLALTGYAIYNPQIFLSHSYSFAGVEFDFGADNPIRQKIWIAGIGGFCWFTVIALTAEAHSLPLLRLYGMALSVFAAFCLWLGLSREAIVASGWLLVLACFVSISYAPWLFSKPDNHAFSLFNRRLLIAASLRWLAFFIAIAMIVGAFALVADAALFSRAPGLNLGWLGFSVMIFLLCCYLPINLLAGIPKRIENVVAESASLGQAMKWRTKSQVTLLLVIELLLLGIPFGVFEWHPATTVKATLLLLILGVFIHICCYVIRGINRFSYWLYDGFYLIALFPSLFVLSKLYPYISKYGFTTHRYLACLLALWLIIVSVLYYAQNERFKLQTVAKSLALLCLLAVVGPWRVSQVPAESQFNRWIALLEIKGLLKNGRYTPPQHMKFEDYQREIQPILYQMIYLCNFDLDLKTKIRAWLADKSEFDSQFPPENTRKWDSYQRQEHYWKIAKYLQLVQVVESKDESKHGNFPPPSVVGVLPPNFKPIYSVVLETPDLETLINIKECEYFLSFDSFSLTSDVNGYYQARGDSKDKPLQLLHLKNTADGRINIAFGTLAPSDGIKNIPIQDFIVASSFVDPARVTAKIRLISIDLQTLLAKLEKTHPQSFANAKPLIDDDPSTMIIRIPPVSNGKHPMILNLRGKHVHGKGVISAIGYQWDDKTQKKKIGVFNAALCLHLES